MGIITNYLLLMLRSPADFRDALSRRFSLTQYKTVLTGDGFLSTLRRTLYLRFGTSARVSTLMAFLRHLNSPRVFVVDEFFSLNCLDLKKLKLLGSIIYVSQDIAYNRYDFAGNFISKELMFRLERDALVNFDLVVACNEREKLTYLEMGAKNAIFYPNIYPTKEFEPSEKDEMPSISIVLRDHWGSRSEQCLNTIFNALGSLDSQLIVHLMGARAPRVPKNITIKYHEFMPSKLDYLKVLSKSWIGINAGIHMAGTNERKYDYAEAGTVVFSDTLGVRGDLLLHEYTYVDSNDLTAKIGQLLELGKANLFEMGNGNRRYVLALAEKERQKLSGTLARMTSDVS